MKAMEIEQENGVRTGEPGTTVVTQHAVAGLSFDEARLEERRKTLGASEIAAVAGLNPYRTALDVYLEKKGIVAPFAGNALTEWGLRLESAIREKYAEVTGSHVYCSGTIVHAVEPWMSCTPDGLVASETPGAFRHGVEIKRYNEWRADDFGVPGSGEVPVDVTAQALWCMMITKLDRWDVAVLIGQADFRIYRIEYDDVAANALHDAGYDFWHKHVLLGVEPAVDGSRSAHKYLQEKYAAHSAILLDPTPEQVHAARQLARVKAEIKALEAEKTAIEHQLQSAIGDAAGIRGIATWKLDKIGRPGWKSIAEALGAKDPRHAPLIAQHTSPPSRRFLLLNQD